MLEAASSIKPEAAPAETSSHRGSTLGMAAWWKKRTGNEAQCHRHVDRRLSDA
jgi:hypothetical protein